MMTHKEKLEYNKHFETLFGAYLQELNDPMKTNTQFPRKLRLFIWQLTLIRKGVTWLCIWNMYFPSPEERSLTYQWKFWLLQPWIKWHQTIKLWLSSLKTSQVCYYIQMIVCQDCNMKIKIQIKTYIWWWTKCTQRSHQTRWKSGYRITIWHFSSVRPNIDQIFLNEAEEYAGGHKISMIMNQII